MSSGGTLSNDDTRFLQGKRSIRLVPAGAGDGVQTDNSTSAAAATTYIASVYVRADASTTVTLRLVSDAGDIGTNVGVSVNNHEWTRITVSGTTPGGGTFIYLQVESVGGTVGFNIDAIQIETGSTASPWVDGTSVLGGLEYSSGLVESFHDFTIAFWLKSVGSTPVTEETVVQIPVLDGSIEIQRDNFPLIGDSNLLFNTTSNDGATTDFLSASSVFDGTWRHVACVVRRDPESGESGVVKEIYIDGSSVSTSTASASLPDLKFNSGVFVGNNSAGTARLDDNELSDLMFLPWAAPADQVAAWFAMGRSMSPLPRIFLDGEIVPEDEFVVEVEGTARSRFIVANVDSFQRSNAREVDIELMEV